MCYNFLLSLVTIMYVGRVLDSRETLEIVKTLTAKRREDSEISTIEVLLNRR